MRKNRGKVCIIFSIILILCSPIISSMSNTTINIENPVAQSEKVTIEKNLNPDIATAIQMVNESLLREYMRVLTVEIGPRMTGTYGCEEAAKYMFEQFENMGLETRYHYWEGISDRRPFRKYRSQNVEATHYGKDDTCDEILVFNAHYDTIKTSPGAIDDGSGTVAVMAAAYVLSQFEFNRTIKFVCFSGEEVGLLGSRNYVRELYKNDTEILVEFNADMIGYANTSEEGRIVRVSPSQDAKWITDEIGNVNEDYGIDFTIERGWNISADYARSGSDFYDFILHGYDAVAFWEKGSYNYFHDPEDTFDKVNFSYLTNVTRLIVASIAHMADIDVYYPHVTIGAPRRGRLYFEDRTLKKFKYERTIVIDDFLIHAEVKPGDAPIEKVEFYYDGKLIHTDTEMPYQYRLNKFSIRKHTVEVIVYDELGRTAQDKVKFRYINLNRKK